MSRIEYLISAVKQIAIDVHQELGPGLFESAHERIFILLEGMLVVEIKSMGRARAIDGIDRVVNFRVQPHAGDP